MAGSLFRRSRDRINVMKIETDLPKEIFHR